MKRYEGSEIIGYRAPKFDELILPLGPPTDTTGGSYKKSLKIDGLVSRYTYMCWSAGVYFTNELEEPAQSDGLTAP